LPGALGLLRVLVFKNLSLDTHDPFTDFIDLLCLPFSDPFLSADDDRNLRVQWRTPRGE